MIKYMLKVVRDGVMKNIRTRIIRLGIYIGKVLLNIIYFFIKLCPSKNKIVMLSRQSNKINIDFSLIEDEIKKRNSNVKVKIFCRTIENSLKDKTSYCFYILKQIYHIATSKVCIIDGYSIPISILKHKKKLIIIQIWHASGAVKKFGYQSLNKKEGRGKEISKVMNMHKNYSFIMAPSKATAVFYKEAFGIDDDKKVFINGMPRLDYILDKTISNEKIEKFYDEYSEYKGKKTILYVPTFRKHTDNTENIEKLINSINHNKYNLIIKLHPLDESKRDSKYKVDKKYNTFDLIKIADYIITDYSAVSFETSLLNKPLYFYVYDINKYKDARGLNINLLNEMRNCSSTNAKELIQSIENDNYDFEELNRFREKYIEKKDVNNTKRLVDFIFNYLDKGVNDENSKNKIK